MNFQINKHLLVVCNDLLHMIFLIILQPFKQFVLMFKHLLIFKEIEIFFKLLWILFELNLVQILQLCLFGQIRKLHSFCVLLSVVVLDFLFNDLLIVRLSLVTEDRNCFCVFNIWFIVTMNFFKFPNVLLVFWLLNFSLWISISKHILMIVIMSYILDSFLCRQVHDLLFEKIAKRFLLFNFVKFLFDLVADVLVVLEIRKYVPHWPFLRTFMSELGCFHWVFDIWFI